MPASRARPAMYNTPSLRNGGFGALQVEAVTNRPLSIARRHLAASQLRMRDIEPDQLTSSEWVRFLVMEERERERWMANFNRHRRNSDESTSSADMDHDAAYDKAEEARQEAEEAQRAEQRVLIGDGGSSSTYEPTGTTPSVSIWARQFDEQNNGEGTAYSARRPMHARRAVTDGIVEAPPTYENAVRSRTPPPAYQPRGRDDEPSSPLSPVSPRHVRFDV